MTYTIARGRVGSGYLALAAVLLLLVGIIVLTAFNAKVDLGREFASGAVIGVGIGILCAVGLKR